LVTIIGTLMGAVVGDVPAALTGALTGDLVGAVLSAFDGAFVGGFIGRFVGAFVGIFVGALVGVLDGLLVGDLVGDLVGGGNTHVCSVWRTFGSRLGSAVRRDRRTIERGIDWINEIRRQYCHIFVTQGCACLDWVQRRVRTIGLIIISKRSN
jgi:hypothetical protein